jgi:hypothetical protein
VQCSIAFVGASLWQNPLVCPLIQTLAGEPAEGACLSRATTPVTIAEILVPAKWPYGAQKLPGIATSFHYVALDNSPGGRRYARAHSDLPVTHAVAPRLVRPPLWFGMRYEQDQVIDATLETLRTLR